MNRELPQFLGLTMVMICVLILHQGQLAAQSISGLWTVSEVRVAGEVLTPVAKWVNIDADGEFQAGNGWLQTGKGKWDIRNDSLSMVEDDGLWDPFGRFAFTLSKDQMEWSRVEEGERVVVVLVRTSEKPMGPADLLVGIWVLDQVTSDGKDITKEFDPDGIYYMFYRWDRIYVEGDVDLKRYTGYWHMHGHRPELTIMPHAAGAEPETWNVDFPEGQLIMKGKSQEKAGVEMRFHRSDRFPD